MDPHTFSRLQKIIQAKRKDIERRRDEVMRKGYEMHEREYYKGYLKALDELEHEIRLECRK